MPIGVQRWPLQSPGRRCVARRAPHQCARAPAVLGQELCMLWEVRRRASRPTTARPPVRSVRSQCRDEPLAVVISVACAVLDFLG